MFSSGVSYIQSRLLPIKTESRKFPFHFHVSLALSYHVRTTARFMIKTAHIFKICNVRHWFLKNLKKQRFVKILERRFDLKA